MSELTHGALFNGIGGFTLAAQWAGIETLWTCEIDDYCNRVSKQHFPNAEQFRDIRDLHNPPYVDILSGGFPCQPFSQAGKRKGAADDRYLWPEMLRIISEVKPAYIIGENVTGIINLALGQVLSDLESIGYDFPRDIHGLPIVPIIPAASVNAPHKRDRVWIISYSGSVGRQQHGSAANSRQEDYSQTSVRSDIERLGGERGVDDTNSDGYGANNRSGSYPTKEGKSQTVRQERERVRTEFGGVFETIPNTVSERGCSRNGERENAIYADTRCETVRAGSNCEWWSVEPNVGRVANGVPNRLDRLKALGNAIVPQVAHQIFECIKAHHLLIQEAAA